MKVSFDFDDTLDRESIQTYAKELIERGFEVWVVTSRPSTEEYILKWKTDLYYGKKANADLYEVTRNLGIKPKRIKFMNFTSKYLFFKESDFLWHLDDDIQEVNQINKMTKVKGLSSLNPNWKHKCEKIIWRYNNEMD